ncbi:hypothetical protein NDU88_001003 [Pleurodeles waltl]|uniref:Uncharacterized protein n=1 Tax=Pleurodeles waltl TaxID=8319 RepID=A0AAV7MJR1_PLEWA|nr:hypothetical protein NDU88_001003 [Pleurodeles waltl]
MGSSSRVRAGDGSSSKAGARDEAPGGWRLGPAFVLIRPRRAAWWRDQGRGRVPSAASKQMAGGSPRAGV